jgi:hypothetical protein
MPLVGTLLALTLIKAEPLRAKPGAVRAVLHLYIESLLRKAEGGTIADSVRA